MANYGPTARQVRWSAVVPWTSSSGRPAPTANTAIGVPSGAITRRVGSSGNAAGKR